MTLKLTESAIFRDQTAGPQLILAAELNAKETRCRRNFFRRNIALGNLYAKL